MKHKDIVHQISFYTSAYVATQVVTVIAAVLMRRFLGPVQVGVWALVQVVLSYAEYSTLGVASAVPREIPFYVGKSRIDEANSLKNDVLHFTLLASAVVAAGISLFAIFFKKNMAPELFGGLLFAALLLLLQQMNNMLINFLRAFKRFKVAGSQMFFSAIINALLVSTLSYWFHLYGFMIAMCLSFIFNIGYIGVHEKLSIGFRFHWKPIQNLMILGFPLMTVALMVTLLQTLDRIVISKYLGLEMLGFYSIATMFKGFLVSFPSSICVVLLPNIAEKFGANENRRDLIGYLEASDTVLTYVMSILIGLSWFFMPLFVDWLLPKFSAGILTAQYLMLGSFFFALSQSYESFVVVIRKPFSIFPILIITLVASWILSCYAATHGWGISGIAIIQTGANAFYFVLLAFLAGHYLKAAKARISEIVKVLFRFAYMASLLWLISRFVFLTNPWTNASLQALIFLSAYVPFFIKIERQYHLGKILVSKLLRSPVAADGQPL